MINPLTGEEIELDPITGQPLISPAQPNMAPSTNQPTGLNQGVKDYLSKKYNLGEYSDDNRRKLQEGSEIGLQDKFAAALAAAGAGFGGRDAASAGMSKLNSIKQDKRQQLEDFDKGRSNFIQEQGLNRQLTREEREDEDYNKTQEKLKRELDVNSEESKMAQDLARSMGYTGNIDTITASQFKEFSPALQKKYEIAERSLDRAEARADRAETRSEARADRQFQRDQSRATKAAEINDKDIQKLSKDVAGVQDMTNALDEIETTLGGKLEEFTTEGGLKKGGKDVDLPGVSVPGIGRVSAYSDKAQQLQGAASKVFNTVLKDRSGAAVSNTELERLKTEFGEGKYNTEAQMVGALQRYKRAVNTELKNREAAYRPEVVEKYTEQGGRTSKTEGIKPNTSVDAEVETKQVGGKTYKKVPGGWELVK